MINEFKLWLSLSCASERAEVITEGFELLEAIDGPDLEEMQSNLMSVSAQLDTFTMLNNVSTELAYFCSMALQRFDITIPDDNYTMESQGTVNAILRTLISLDAYELPEEILAITSVDQNAEDTLAELVAHVANVDFNDVVELVGTVSPSLISKVHSLAEEAVRSRTDGLEETVNLEATLKPYLLKVTQWVVASRQKAGESELDPVLEYGLGHGKLGLPINAYITLFAEELLDSKQMTHVAERWLLIALYANIGPEVVLTTLPIYFEQLYPELTEVMAVRKALVTLLDTLGVTV